MTEMPTIAVGTPAPDAEKVGAPSLDMGSLPAGVAGTMDGEKPPMNKVEEIKQALEPYQQKYGHYLAKIRPWREFLALSRPNGDIRQRLESNLTHYQINYAVIFMVLMVTSIVMNPKCLVVIFVLVLVWIAFLRKNDDPEWQVSVGGVPLGKTQRWMILTAMTAIVLLNVASQVVFSAAFCCAFLVLLHGVMHAPQEGDNATEEEKQEMV